MTDIKSVTVSKRKFMVFIIFFITLVIAIFGAWFYVKKYSKRYIKPSFESMSISGTVDIDNNKYGYSVMQFSEEYKVGLCGAPEANNIGVDLYFTNPEENNVLLKCLLLDESGNTIGESGVLNPGTYVKTINFNKIIEPGNYDLTVKVLGFEPETYYSKGIVHLKTHVQVN